MRLFLIFTLFLLFLSALPMQDAFAQALEETPNFDNMRYDNDEGGLSEYAGGEEINPQDIPPEEIPDEYLDEADAFYGECQTTPKFANYYNCECLSTAYLDERIKAGPEADRSSILMYMDNKCHDATKLAGEHYSKCMQRPPGILNRNVDREIYCSCVSNTLAKFYESGQYGTGSASSVRLQSAAASKCNDRDYLIKFMPSE